MDIIYPITEFWIHSKLDKTLMDYVWTQIESAKNDVKHKLVGHINRSLDLPDVEKKLSSHIEEAAKQITYIYQPNNQRRF